MKIDDLIAKFTGCYRVHQSDLGASLCGQLNLTADEESDQGKFVMLLKLKESSFFHFTSSFPITSG